MQQNANVVIATTENANELLTTQLDGTILVNATETTETKKSKKEKHPLYLKEGIKGKNLVSAKIDTNNAHKTDSKSISYCIKRVIKFDNAFLSSFANYKESDITPTNLLPLRKNNEGEKGFSVWLTMQLITRYYKNL